ncbi:CinY protein [Streptomyces sp. NPDC048258]|uniref:CinY protein n=1 Tax=Streptomyces sp. NPDC048258 TaxID=3365527 RepID=UPI003715E73D
MSHASSRVLRRLPATALACGACLIALLPGPARAFSGGNHEKITRAALSWEPGSLSAMADSRDGAIVANDQGDYFDLGILHCDNADHLAPRYGSAYPRTRDQATTELLACIRGSVARLRAAVHDADGLVDAHGKVIARQSDLTSPCAWNGRPERAKCNVLEQLGRDWHAIEDFYSHGNWSDKADDAVPIGTTNPPGLNRTTIAPFLDIRRYSSMDDAEWTREAAGLIPEDLATGCYPDFDSTGYKPTDCAGRIKHNGTLNKDTEASERSRNGNFQRASELAAQDIARQWKDFTAELIETYPDHRRGEQMICALTHDTPASSCP